MVQTLMLQEIYKIQDSIAKLSTTIESKDSTVVSVLADKLANINTKSPETALLETFITRIFDNPEQMLKLVEISQKLPVKQ